MSEDTRAKYLNTFTQRIKGFLESSISKSELAVQTYSEEEWGVITLGFQDKRTGEFVRVTIEKEDPEESERE